MQKIKRFFASVFAKIKNAVFAAFAFCKNKLLFIAGKIGGFFKTAFKKIKPFAKAAAPFAGRAVYAALFLAICAAIIFNIEILTRETIAPIFTEEGKAAKLVYAAYTLGDAENGSREQTVYVNDGGKVKKYTTAARTVNELFLENSIVMGLYDSAVPFGNAALADGMTVYITRVEYHTEYLETEIPFETVVNDVDTVMKDKTVTVIEGVNGKVEETLSVRYVNGKRTDQVNVISTEVIKDPVTCVMEHGVGGTFTSPDGTVYEYLYRIKATATAYYDKYNRGKTATGHATVEGVMAVDKKVIPLHSKCYVIGRAGDFNILQAEDVGNFRGNWIDILFDSYEECCRFGRQKMDVYVLEVNSCAKKVHTPAATKDLAYKGANWIYTNPDWNYLK